MMKNRTGVRLGLRAMDAGLLPRPAVPPVFVIRTNGGPVKGCIGELLTAAEPWWWPGVSAAASRTNFMIACMQRA